jgi:serine/threonine protein kinase
MVETGETAAQEPILLKNRIAVLTPEPIAEGSFGQVYVGKILNPIGLLAERIIWGEESPRWLGLDDIPFNEPPKDDPHGGLPTPLSEPGQVRRVYQAADRLWTDYLGRRKQDRQKADEEYRDLLRLIDPMLHEDRIIAVKILRPPSDKADEAEAKSTADSVRRFIKENDILRALRHPGIVRRFGLVRDEKMGWCLLLEYIEGETLDVHLRKFEKGRMPLSKAAGLIREISDAIGYVHAAGVVHRDLKPQNIMIRKDDGRAVLMDFGIGKWVDESNTQALTMTGVRIGTPRYMAPEQARAEAPITQAADVYQLATILFELVTGHPAYENMHFERVFEWLLDGVRGHPTTVRDFTPSISREFEALIEIGRDKEPDRRWTIEEFKDRTERIVSEKRFEGKEEETPENRTGLVETLRLTRVRKKEILWEERQLEGRLKLEELRLRIQETWALLERKAYLDARPIVDKLVHEAAGLPARQEVLRKEVENLERAFTMASARSEAEFLLGLAEQHQAAARYAEAGGALDAAGKRLATLPKDAYGDVHKRFQALNEAYESHRSYVDLFNTLRKSFVEKIQERYRELHEWYGAGKPLSSAKVVEVLDQVAAAQKNLEAIERDKVGPAAYDLVQKDVDELRIALEDLRRRAGSPA